MPCRFRLVILMIALSAAAASAQPGPMIIGPPPVEAPDGPRDPRQGVYVRDSAVAAEKLALAERMERLKQWDKSADVYQEIVEKYADRVVSVAGADPSSQRYTSVTLKVQELLGKWPQEGL